MERRRIASPSSAAGGAESGSGSGSVHRTERWMTAAGRSLQRRTGYRCHSAPSCSVAQAWARGGAKDEKEDRKLRVPGGGGGPVSG